MIASVRGERSSYCDKRTLSRQTCISNVQHLVPELRSLQVLLVFGLISAYELGPGPISWFIAAELFDQPGRPMAMAFTSMLNWGGKFVLALLFPPLLVGLYLCTCTASSTSDETVSCLSQRHRC